MNIEGLNKAEILKELYNNSRPLGLGILHYDPKPMTIEEATEILKHTTKFDYLYGRVMKIDLSTNTPTGKCIFISNFLSIFYLLIQYII